MKTCEEMVNSLLERREQYQFQQKKKREIIIRAVTTFGCVCLVALVGVGLWMKGIPSDNLQMPSENDHITETVSNVSQDVLEETDPSIDQPAVLEEESREQSAEESKEHQNQEPSKTEPKPSKPDNTANQTSKPQQEENASSTPQKPTPPVEASEASDLGTGDAGNGDLAPDYPGYGTEEGLINWMLGNDNSFSNIHAKRLLEIITKGDKVTYYRPTALLDFVQSNSPKYRFRGISVEGSICFGSDGLKEVELEGNKYNIYRDFVRLYVHYEKEQYLEDSFNESKQKWMEQDERYYVTTVDGIEFVCFRNNNDETIVDWQQFGQYHWAFVGAGYFDRIEEVLPLLILEKVTLSKNAKF